MGIWKWEVGNSQNFSIFSKKLNCTPRNEKWDSNKNSHFQSFPLWTTTTVAGWKMGEQALLLYSKTPPGTSLIFLPAAAMRYPGQWLTLPWSEGWSHCYHFVKSRWMIGRMLVFKVFVARWSIGPLPSCSAPGKICRNSKMTLVFHHRRKKLCPDLCSKATL